ncbi:hypothetical protein A3H40_00140 [Candidatus Daviesbacteria bacterium RIFCSPLOWO2_02_FULL_38_15]|nr:MAG: hypothetical protein A3H40_00140 [Candidatus Daviesbacteria bacterium RIFCSPLOWO2_02_FULL_38_15]
MDKKTAILTGLVLALIAGVVFIIYRPQQNPLITGSINQSDSKIVPSEILKTYNDPSGFTFDYPDNLSLTKNETENPSFYADIRLSSKDVDGNLALKISDTTFSSLDDWLEVNKGNSKNTPKEVKLGNLKAMEIKTEDRLLLGALDSRVLFTIEMPKIEEDFWNKVYSKVLADFTFVAPTAEDSQTSGDQSDVAFEGEEVVE